MTPKPLPTATALTTQIIVPPGYRRFFKYGLALEIAAEFGVEPPPRVVINAAKARVQLQRMNGKNDVLGLPAMLPGTGNMSGYWAFYTGG